MIFLLITIIPLSIVFAVVSLVFPLAIISSVLQSLIFLLSLFVLLNRKKRNKGLVKASATFFIHLVLCVACLTALFTIALPQQREGDTGEIAQGIKNFISSKYPSLNFMFDNKSEYMDSFPSDTQNENTSIEDPF